MSRGLGARKWQTKQGHKVRSAATSTMRQHRSMAHEVSQHGTKHDIPVTDSSDARLSTLKTSRQNRHGSPITFVNHGEEVVSLGAPDIHPAGRHSFRKRPFFVYLRISPKSRGPSCRGSPVSGQCGYEERPRDGASGPVAAASCRCQFYTREDPESSLLSRSLLYRTPSL
jgi:hypothetical protein